MPLERTDEPGKVTKSGGLDVPFHDDEPAGGRPKNASQNSQLTLAPSPAGLQASAPVPAGPSLARGNIVAARDKSLRPRG